MPPSEPVSIGFTRPFRELDFISWDVAIGHDGDPTGSRVSSSVGAKSGHSLALLCSGIPSSIKSCVLVRVDRWQMIPGMGASDEVDADALPVQFP